MSPHDHGDLRQQSVLGHLSHELQVFPTPWHRYVHGLGLGQEPTGFDASKAERLLETSRLLGRTTGSPYHACSHQLLEGLVSTCESRSSGGDGADQHSHPALAMAVAQLAQLSDPWQSGHACAMVIESLVKVDQLEPYQSPLRQHLQAALQRLETLSPTTDKDRYERLQLFGNLMLAAGQAGWTDLLTATRRDGTTCVATALQEIDTISEVFYRGRGAAMLFTALGIIDFGEHVCDGPRDHVRHLLEVFEAHLQATSAHANRQAYHDPVHSAVDLFMFPLSLTLNAIAILGRRDYLEYQRNWIEQAVTYFQLLPVASRASQVMFYVFALNNLGVLDEQVPDLSVLLQDCMAGFLQTSDSTRVDDYLRCTYLIHLAWQMGRFDVLTPRVWAILEDSLPRIAGSELYRQSAYGSSYMVAAYTLSALDIGGRFEALFGDKINLLAAIGRFKEDAQTTALTLPRLDFALIDAALRLRPADAGDTALFRPMRLGRSA